MKRLLKRTARFLADPGAVIFGIAVFNFVWIELGKQDWHFHRNICMAVLMLVSSLLLLANKPWSNLIAAIIGGQLPLGLLWDFLMLAHNAEVPMLSYRHVSYFFSGLEIERGALLILALALMILWRAMFALMRMIKEAR
jgi:hypothetical protein